VALALVVGLLADPPDAPLLWAWPSPPELWPARLDLERAIRYEERDLIFVDLVRASLDHHMDVQYEMAVSSISRLVYEAGDCRYKIGIAIEPCYRFFNTIFGYWRIHGYSYMHVLSLVSKSQARALERQCIAAVFGRIRGCQNAEGSGGEGMAEGDSPCYLYVVLASSADYNAFKRAQREGNVFR
jgi:hypothetical protein